MKALKTASALTEVVDGFIMLRTPGGEHDTHRLYVGMTQALERMHAPLTVRGEAESAAGVSGRAACLPSTAPLAGCDALSVLQLCLLASAQGGQTQAVLRL